MDGDAEKRAVTLRVMRAFSGLPGAPRTAWAFVIQLRFLGLIQPRWPHASIALKIVILLQALSKAPLLLTPLTYLHVGDTAIGVLDWTLLYP